MRQLDSTTLVSAQLFPADVPVLRSDGVTMIVNNRPDGEEAGQPTSAEIEAAARAAGLDYRYIPVSSGFSAEQVEAMSAALEEAQGPVLAFCRSGTRSTFLWALARAQAGEDADELVRKAAGAGYDLTAIRAYL